MTSCDLTELDPASLSTHSAVRRIAWRGTAAPEDSREVPEEAAIAVTYNGATHAVMMATPLQLEDFAVGFSLTERIITDIEQIKSIEIAAFTTGVEARLWVDEECAGRLSARRRALAGPTGCGLCGVESLEEALPEPAPVGADGVRFTPEQVMEAINALSQGQPLFRETHAVHAAGFWTPSRGLVAAREDLGRHNAMDKLVGALRRGGVDQTMGIATITSRVSVEIVQKAAVMGVPVLVAVSAPTRLAIRTAESAGLTLVGVARRDGFEVFTRMDRIAF
ncbi:formate dehydrogenase accessory sulfurtransferase FdhD [Breoghania sp. JC706]|uniref:formate dehydrogenase accessory sulfurtransferase FdhD n=1 Tax=Breoghania sp. JC706 TaxID=3117732 RepID=UPI0030097699